MTTETLTDDGLLVQIKRSVVTYERVYIGGKRHCVEITAEDGKIVEFTLTELPRGTRATVMALDEHKLDDLMSLLEYARGQVSRLELGEE